MAVKIFVKKAVQYDKTVGKVGNNMKGQTADMCREKSLQVGNLCSKNTAKIKNKEGFQQGQQS